LSAVAVLEKVVATQASSANLIIRLMVGGVFLSEGIQKFLFPAELGAGRFTKIGLPMPQFLAAWVGVWEILAGAFLLAGLLTRIGAIAMIVNMLVAIATTKIPILMNSGFWAMAHEARTDYSMLMGSVFLLLVGAGSWSIDALLASRSGAANQRR
jgi:putative oxidoreductase